MKIILAVADAMRASELGCYGYHRNTTPVLDEMAKEGMFFKQCHSCSNHTDPSFTSIMTGSFPHQHGIIQHGMKNAEPKYPFLTNELPPNYYSTSIDWLGRWHKIGFQEYGEPQTIGTVARDVIKVFVPHPVRVLIRTTIGASQLQSRLSAKQYTDKAIKTLNSHDNLFLLIHYWDSHTPFDQLPQKDREKWQRKPKTPINKILKNTPQKWREVATTYHLRKIKYAEQVQDWYDAGINIIDHQMQRLWDYTKDHPDTLLIFTADHGDNLIRDGKFYGHHGLNKNITHVPLILAGDMVQTTQMKDFFQHNELRQLIHHAINHEHTPYSVMKRTYGHNHITSTHTFDATAEFRLATRSKKHLFIWSPSKEESKTKYEVSWKAPIELYNLTKDPHELENSIDQLSNRLFGFMQTHTKNWLKNTPPRPEVNT